METGGTAAGPLVIDEVGTSTQELRSTVHRLQGQLSWVEGWGLLACRIQGKLSWARTEGHLWVACGIQGQLSYPRTQLQLWLACRIQG